MFQVFCFQGHSSPHLRIKLALMSSLPPPWPALLVSCSATSGLFKWTFNGAGETLTECASLPVTLTGSGNAPYYMIAFAVDGTPTTSLIGSDSNSLAWIVNQPAGTKMLLNVVDSTGSSGGTSALIYTVASGQSTSCLVNTATGFSLSSNATNDEISTCDPWGLVIRGGKSPYTVTLAAVGSPSVTNVTMPVGDNAYTYINRADPNGSILAAISDSTGNWASGTPYVKTKGASDTSCGGAASSSGKASVDDTAPSKTSTTTSGTMNTGGATPNVGTNTQASSQTGMATSGGAAPSTTNGAVILKGFPFTPLAMVASVVLALAG
ncbi:hypothetical protein FPV67DRAFT_251192 [Lyophyllum atratum]|nr:hypothetical protein FPV67DRAFT_251192 [Lyophyllum atratum]